MSAQPFIRPAFDAFKSTFSAQLAAQLRTQYDRVVKKYVKSAGK
jgi:hypothetical protein